MPCAPIRVDALKAKSAQLRAALAAEARYLLVAFGCRPIVNDQREVCLARTEQIKSMDFNEAHARAQAAALGLRHLVSSAAVRGGEIEGLRWRNWAGLYPAECGYYG